MATPPGWKRARVCRRERGGRDEDALDSAGTLSRRWQEPGLRPRSARGVLAGMVHTPAARG